MTAVRTTDPTMSDLVSELIKQCNLCSRTKKLNLGVDFKSQFSVSHHTVATKETQWIDLLHVSLEPGMFPSPICLSISPSSYISILVTQSSDLVSQFVCLFLPGVAGKGIRKHMQKRKPRLHHPHADVIAQVHPKTDKPARSTWISSEKMYLCP